MKNKKIITVMLATIILTFIFVCCNEIRKKKLTGETVIKSFKILEYNISELFKMTHNNVEIGYNSENDYIYDEKLNIYINISDFSYINEYKLKIYENGYEVIDCKIDEGKANNIILCSEGKNSIKIEIYKDDDKIFTDNKDIFYIKSYNNQFAEKINKKGFHVHYMDGTRENYDISGKILKSIGAQIIRTDFRTWKLQIDRKKI